MSSSGGRVLVPKTCPLLERLVLFVCTPNPVAFLLLVSYFPGPGLVAVFTAHGSAPGHFLAPSEYEGASTFRELLFSFFLPDPKYPYVEQ